MLTLVMIAAALVQIVASTVALTLVIAAAEIALAALGNLR